MKEGYFETPEKAVEFKKNLKGLLNLLLFLGALALLFIWYTGLYQASSFRLYCDAEQTGRQYGRTTFVGDNGQLSSGHMQRSEQAHSGKHSLLLTKDNLFGFEYILSDLKGDEKIKVSVWRYTGDPGYQQGMIVGSIDGGLLWKGSGPPVKKEDNGWELLELTIEPNLQYKNKTMKIYCWNNGKRSIYFDDMTIEVERVEKL